MSEGLNKTRVISMIRISSLFEERSLIRGLLNSSYNTVDHGQAMIKSCTQRNCNPMRNLAVNDNLIRNTYGLWYKMWCKTSVWGKCWGGERRTLRVIYRWNIVDIIRPNILKVMYVYLLLLPSLIYPDIHPNTENFCLSIFDVISTAISLNL